MGPEHTGAGPKGKPVSTPRKRCRHCGTESETFEANCPKCGKPYGLSKGATVGIVVAAILAAVVLLGGCAAAIVAGINDLEESTITREEFDAVNLGVTRDDLEDDLGEPYEVGELDEGPTHVTCLYYNEEGESGIDDPYLQFCFVAGVLDSKFAPP